MEQDLIEQVRQRMRQQGVTQESLAKQLFGDKATRQHINPYLTGARGLLQGNGLKILEALGLKRLIAEWQDG